MKKILTLVFVAAVACWATTKKADIDCAVIDTYSNSEGTAAPVETRAGVQLVDSSGNTLSLWTQMQECLAYNPVISGLEFVCRGFTATGQLNVTQTDDLWTFWVSDPAVYDQDFGLGRYPTAVASDNGGNNGPHIGFPTTDGTAWGNMGGVYESAGWWNSFWDGPIDLGPGDVNTHKVIGKQLPNGNILYIGYTDDGGNSGGYMRYRTMTPNLGTTVAQGNVNSAFMHYWGFDVGSSGATVVYYNDALTVYYKTTTDGVTWSSQQTYNLVWPNPYSQNTIYWTQMALNGNGTPLLVFDNIDANDPDWPYYGKVYVSPGSGQTCIEVSSDFGATDTECTYPTIGTAGTNAVVIYNTPRNNLADSMCFWDIYENFSTNNGVTWQANPKRLTGGTSYNHNIPQIAKRLNNGDSRFYYTFGVNRTNPNFDILWDFISANNQYPQARWYVAWDPINALEEQKTTAPAKLSLNINPNPARNRALVSYSLPYSGGMSVRLYSTDGRLVRDLDSGTKDAGVYTVNVNTANLANGTYIVILDTDGRITSNSLVVVR